MNKVTGNKLVAEFMGWGIWKSMFDGEGCNIDTKIIPEAYTDHSSFHKTKNLLFHSSWDWLMPVVDKIEHLGETDKSLGYIDINSHHCKIVSLIKNQPNIIVGSYSKSPEKIKTATKIRAVWLAVVTFIQWYNNNN